MKVEVESLDKVRRKIDVLLDEEQVRKLREGIQDELKRRAKIKGFRPGKVPLSLIQTYYKEYIEEEMGKQMVSSTFSEALTEAKVDPIGQPDIHLNEDQARPGYTIECEIIPEFDLPEYRGVEVDVEKRDVTEEEIEQRLESVRKMHAELVDKEGEAAKGDFVVVSYEGFLDGKPVKGAKSDRYPMELGTSRVLPQFEDVLPGMRVGEEKEVDVPFAEDYPDKEIAGKTLRFKLGLKEVKEKKFPEMNEEFAKDLGFDTVEAMKEGVKAEIGKEKEVQKRNETGDKILDGVLQKIDIAVPPKLLAKRVEGMIEEARTRMGSGDLQGEGLAGIEAALRKEFEPEAEKRIRTQMILMRIADAEGITIKESDVEDRLRRIAEESKRAYDYIRDFYDKYDLRESLKGSMRDEKTVDFLIEHAKIKEKE